MNSRACPKCGKILTYKNKYTYFKAKTKNTKCVACTQESKKNGKEVECFICKKFFYKQPNQIKEKNYCSRDCANKGHALFQTKYVYEVVKCENCSSSFQQLAHRKKFCSTKCSSQYNLKTINSVEPKKKKTFPELEFKAFLEENKILFVFQKDIPWKKGWKKWYDFYLPDSNLLIEIDGTYWHGKGVCTKDLNKQQWKTRANDRLKNLIAKKRGYRLLRIWSDEINLITLKDIT